jgi:hypothetical protein
MGRNQHTQHTHGHGHESVLGATVSIKLLALHNFAAASCWLFLLQYLMAAIFGILGGCFVPEEQPEEHEPSM